ncbi:MAG TPA: NTP transferase domain-containing protein [Syntrophorhabdaceae bacterium]|nr:NTP transferase domain-containing protein [Syntrophorhabdaceae bacterium]
MNTKIGAIIQARMSSKRFPGKVLYEVKGKPLIQYIIESLQQCRAVNEMVVATSSDESDTPIEIFCDERGICCFRGNLLNVADRFRETALKFGYDGFVRINGDSPVIDYRLIDRAVSIFCEGDYDVVTNVLVRTFPKGQSVEVLKTSSFVEACMNLSDDDDREHVTRYLYRNADHYRIYNIQSSRNYSTVQLSVDTREDMERFKALINRMNRFHWEYTVDELVSIRSSLS